MQRYNKRLSRRATKLLEDFLCLNAVGSLGGGGGGMKTMTGIIVLVDDGYDMAASPPAHNTDHAAVTKIIRLHLKYSASFLWRSCRWQLFLSGCIRQDRAARHSLVRVETAEGRKRNARKVQKPRAVLKSRLVVPQLPFSLPCFASVVDRN